MNDGDKQTWWRNSSKRDYPQAELIAALRKAWDNAVSDQEDTHQDKKEE